MGRCATENAKTVVCVLTKEIIPRFGVPLQIDSDKGTAFTSQLTQRLSDYLAIDWKFHIPYHPQSSRVVERMNRTLKDSFSKAMQQRGSTAWPDVLPAVLTEIRMTPSKTTRLSPFEVLFGRSFPTAWKMSTNFSTSAGSGVDIHVDDYVSKLLDVLQEKHECVRAKLPLPSQNPTHSFIPGEQVPKWSKQLGEPKYTGPYEVVAVTRTADIRRPHLAACQLVKICEQIIA